MSLFTTQIAALILRSQDDAFDTNASLAADILIVAATISALVVSVLDHQRSLRPSTLLSLYLSAYAILGTARTRTAWLIKSSDSVSPIVTVTTALAFVAILLESTRKNTKHLSDKHAVAPEQLRGIWNRTLFSWLLVCFKAGYSGILSLDDLPMLDSNLRSKHTHHELISTWAKCRCLGLASC